MRPEVETAAVARNALRLHEDLGAFRQPLAASAAAAHSVVKNLRESVRTQMWEPEIQSRGGINILTWIPR